MNKETQDGIDAWDADRRKRFGRLIDSDGIVSVAPDGVVSYSGGTAYTIAHLNFVLMMATPSIWQRLDKHNLSTPALGSAIRAAISGHLTA